NNEPTTIFYQRSHFTTQLPVNCLYSVSHFWIAESGGNWRVGMTAFGARVVGEIVDFGFDVRPGALIAVDQKLGWVEGFKAVSDLFSLVEGKFLRENPVLQNSPETLNRDCYGAGWLYEAEGSPGPECFSAEGYKTVLDTVIDNLVKSKRSQSES